jgi:hypothetical protein
MEPTRQITTFDWLTTDGYFSGPDGNLDWVVPAEEQAKAAAEGMARIDTLLFGRRTCEIFEKFWPRALEESDEAGAADPHNPGRKSPENRLIAMALNELDWQRQITAHASLRASEARARGDRKVSVRRRPAPLRAQQWRST